MPFLFKSLEQPLASLKISLHILYMSQFILICYTLIITTLGVWQPAQAQYILAGQAAGSNYTDIIPDKTLAVNLLGAVGTIAAVDSLDLDGDGRFDLLLKAEAYAARSTAENPYGGGSSARTDVEAKHPNVAIYNFYPIVGFTSNDTISGRLNNPFWWATASNGSRWLTWVSVNRGGYSRSGSWLDGQEKYMAVRLRPSATAAWRYGWIRIQVNPLNTDAVTMIVKDYALTPAATVLGLPMARAAGWQLFPVPASDWLTVQNPRATTGRLQVVDACGRKQLSIALTGPQHRLNVSTLAAGIYVVHIQTATGNFVQRIIKQ
ncbi:MAG TPA: T9SS type A sorting domain-containing protein [Hymenobacter sp.]